MTQHWSHSMQLLWTDIMLFMCCSVKVMTLKAEPVKINKWYWSYQFPFLQSVFISLSVNCCLLNITTISTFQNKPCLSWVLCLILHYKLDLIRTKSAAFFPLCLQCTRSIKGWLVGEAEPCWTPPGWTKGMFNSCQTSLADFRSESWPFRLLWKVSKTLKVAGGTWWKPWCLFSWINDRRLVFYYPPSAGLPRGWHTSIFLFSFVPRVCILFCKHCGIIFPYSLCRCCSEHNLTGPLKHPSLSMPLFLILGCSINSSKTLWVFVSLQKQSPNVLITQVFILIELQPLSP